VGSVPTTARCQTIRLPRRAAIARRANRRASRRVHHLLGQVDVIRRLRNNGLADALTRFIIPANFVPTIRDQLDLVGIDERRLFPDLDGVAAAIRRYYA